MSNGKHRKEPEKCSMCNGFGKIQSSTGDGEPGKPAKTTEITCPGCNGTGQQP